MTQGFLEQWQLYRRGAARPALCGLAPRTEGNFDADVRPGQIRLFADVNRPLVALIVADRGLSGRKIVPISPFSAPASSRELMIGERVYQLWNATVVARRFSDRSWLVDTVSPAELAEILDAIPAAAPGRLVVGDGVQARYEREFLILPGNLIPLVEPSAAEAPRFAWVPAALRFAACLTLCLGAWWVLMMDAGRRTVRTWKESIFPAQIAMDAAPVELAESAEPVEAPTEHAEVDIDFAKPSFTWVGTEPAPQVARVTGLGSVKGPQLPERLARTRYAATFTAPVDCPMAVVFAPSAPVRGVGSSVTAYGAGAQPLSAAPQVAVSLTDCPWNRDTTLLNVAGAAEPGVKVTLEFDPDVVEGYREVSSATSGKMNTYYEVMPFAGKAIAPTSFHATVIWPSAEGDVRTPLEIRECDREELEAVPSKAFRDIIEAL